MLKMDFEYKNNILYVRLKGNLISKNSYKLNNYLLPVLEKYKIKYLVYNLNNLENMDLKGRDAILHSKYIIKRNKGKILLCQENGKVAEFLKGLRLIKIKNERDALALLKV